MHCLLLIVLLLALVPLGSAAGAEPERGAGRNPLWTAVGYLPSRALDLLDVVRVRARVGPGMAISLRASEAADLFLGSYTSVYAGLPGPRGGTLPRLPAGLETRRGAEAGPADLSTGLGFGPKYSASECGIGLHGFLLGFDAGVDPFELIDLAAGLFLLDPSDDDL
jgi:hypothetical protein